MKTLRQGGAMGHTTVVAAPAGATLGERFAALSTAAALGERIRDAGGHALVVLDDISCMVAPTPRSPCAPSIKFASTTAGSRRCYPTVCAGGDVGAHTRQHQHCNAHGWKPKMLLLGISRWRCGSA